MRGEVTAELPVAATERLRAAVRRSGLSGYAIAARAGLHPSHVQSFARGGGISLDGAERVALAIGVIVELVPAGESSNV